MLYFLVFFWNFAELRAESRGALLVPFKPPPPKNPCSPCLNVGLVASRTLCRKN